MNIRKLISSILNRACVFFSVIAFGYALVMWFIYASDGSDVLIRATNLLFYFIFSILLAVANSILTMEGCPKGWRTVIHYLICLFGFYTCFLVPLAMAAAQNFVGIVFFTLIYLSVMGCIALFSSRLKKNKERNEAYRKQYKKK